MFGWSNDIVLRVLFASPLCFLVEHDRCPSLGNVEEVNDLDSGAKYELDPEIPSPVKELLDRATTDAADH